MMFVVMDTETGNAVASFKDRDTAFASLIQSSKSDPDGAESLVVVAVDEDGIATASWDLEDLIVA